MGTDHKRKISEINRQLEIIVNKKKDLDYSSVEYRDLTQQEIDYQKQLLEICDSICTEERIELYKNEGLALFYKGNIILGVHPKNLEDTLERLRKGSMVIDWDHVAVAYRK